MKKTLTEFKTVAFTKEMKAAIDKQRNPSEFVRQAVKEKLEREAK
jgi:Arc/MetJ-type ribon-helix-helix transcriptional regulator